MISSIPAGSVAKNENAAERPKLEELHEASDPVSDQHPAQSESVAFKTYP